MSFDSSRFTFDPRNDFTGVVMQQGRVQLDSDWNEWLAELGRRIQAGTLDTIGRAVFPATTKPAFRSPRPGRRGQRHHRHRPRPHVRGRTAGRKPRPARAQSAEVDSARRHGSRSPASSGIPHSTNCAVRRTFRTSSSRTIPTQCARAVSASRRSLPCVSRRLAAGSHLPRRSGPGRKGRRRRYHRAPADRLAGQVAGREQRSRRQLFDARFEPPGRLAATPAPARRPPDYRHRPVHSLRPLLPHAEHRLHRTGKSVLPRGDSPPRRRCRPVPPPSSGRATMPPWRPPSTGSRAELP